MKTDHIIINIKHRPVLTGIIRGNIRNITMSLEQQKKEEPIFQIVLVAPEIPQNTGNIGRLAVNAKCRLHLIKPISFSFEDKYLKRAGMDYWPHVDCVIHENWDEFAAYAGDTPMYFYSTKEYPFSKLAPTIAGIPIKNENSAATPLLQPIIIAPKIVAPDLDVPGMMEST